MLFQGFSPLPEGIEEEDIRQSIVGTKKHSIGKTWRNDAGEYLRYRSYENNGFDESVEYKIGDSVFIESQGPDKPFYICSITEFKRSKRDTFMVCIRYKSHHIEARIIKTVSRWFYRTTEVPETVYNFLVKDRTTEHGAAAIHDPLVKSRCCNMMLKSSTCFCSEQSSILTFQGAFHLERHRPVSCERPEGEVRCDSLR